MIREVSDKRQAAIDFALGPALGAASIAIGSRITLNTKLADILAKAKETYKELDKEGEVTTVALAKEMNTEAVSPSFHGFRA